MPRIMFINHTCPICGGHVDYAPDFNPKKSTDDHGNVEWVLTKRGLKQYFHTTCYWGLVRAQKIEKELINEKT